jgi:hypothetical protein
MTDHRVLAIAADFEARVGWEPRCPPAIAELLVSGVAQ